MFSRFEYSDTRSFRSTVMVLTISKNLYKRDAFRQNLRMSSWSYLALILSFPILAQANSNPNFRFENVVKPALSQSRCASLIAKSISKSGWSSWHWRQAAEPGPGSARRWLGLSENSPAWSEVIFESPLPGTRSSVAIIRSSAGNTTYFTSSENECQRREEANHADLYANEDWLKIEKLATSKNTIFYSFSNGMPLSGLGIQSILNVAFEKKFQVVIVSDDSINDSDLRALRESTEAKFPNMAGNIHWTKIRSPTLTARGLFQQYPSVLSVVSGKWAHEAYSGHKSELSWSKWLKLALNEKRKSKQ